MKKIRFLMPIFLLLSIVRGISQPVIYFGDVLLQSQAQVDSFPIQYPGVTHVAGNVLIGKFDTIPSDITDLTPLQSLQLVAGNLYVLRNDQLASLQGLNNLDSVYSTVLLQLNPMLFDLTGLDSLKLCNFLDIKDNHSLVSTVGAGNLKQIGYILAIERNDNLIEILGFTNLDSIEFTFINNNPQLTTIGDFPSLRAVENFYVYENPSLVTIGSFPILGQTATGVNAFLNGDFVFMDNQNLENTGQFDMLKYVVDIKITNCPKLHDISGFSKVKQLYSIVVENTAIQEFQFDSIETIAQTIELINNDSLLSIEGLAPQLETELLYTLNIEDNDKLLNLDGLNQVWSIMSEVDVVGNDALHDLDGLSGLQRVGSYGAAIWENRYLSSIDGLRNLEIIDWEFNDLQRGGLGIYRCSSLEGIDSTFKLRAMDGGLSFSNDSALIAVNNNFPYLDTVWRGAVSFSNNLSLVSIDDFDSLGSTAFGVNGNHNLTTLSGFDSFVNIRNLSIRDNGSLKDLATFGGIESIEVNLSLQKNDSLTSIDPFSNITFVGDSISFRDNPILTDCSALCAIMENAFVGEGIKLSGNGFPCSNIEDLEVYCDTLTLVGDQAVEVHLRSAIQISPNPASMYTIVRLPDGFTPPCDVSIVTSKGQLFQIFRMEQSEAQIPTSGFQPGTYHLSATRDDGKKAVGTLVILGH